VDFVLDNIDIIATLLVLGVLIAVVWIAGGEAE
jgi:hypothetical protein